MTALALRHRVLRCVQCGLRTDATTMPGAEANAEQCPKCGCDLLARPPRSYAEMEGLYEEHVESAPVSDGGLQSRLDAAAARWVILLLGVASAGLGAVVCFILFAR